MASVAEWERGILAERTRERLAVTRSRGVRRRPALVPTVVQARLRRVRDGGATLAAIVGGLNADAR